MTNLKDQLRHGLLPLEHALRTVSGHDIALEEYAEHGRYVIRAELPGVNPDRHLSVSVYDGEVKITVDRPELRRHDGSEFRYGTFSRTVALPRRANDDSAVARYDRGVLEISVEVPPAPPISRCVPVTTGPTVEPGRSAVGPAQDGTKVPPRVVRRPCPATAPRRAIEVSPPDARDHRERT